MKRRRTTAEIREAKRKLAEEVEAEVLRLRKLMLAGIEDGSLERHLREKLAETEPNKADGALSHGPARPAAVGKGNAMKRYLHQHYDKATGVLIREQVLDHPFPELDPKVESVKVTTVTNDEVEPDKPSTVTDLRLERRLRRIRKSDGRCYICERPANRHPEIGPLVVSITMPNDLVPGERETAVIELCSWQCLERWARIQNGAPPILWPAAG